LFFETNVCFVSVRKTGYRQCVGYLLANTRVRLDDFYQFYPADKLFDLFITAQPTNNAEILTKEYINVDLINFNQTIEWNFLRLFRLKTFFVFTRFSQIEIRSKLMFENQRSNKWQ